MLEQNDPCGYVATGFIFKQLVEIHVWHRKKQRRLWLKLA